MAGNFFFTSSSPRRTSSKALTMISGSWLRTAPLDSSTPLHTRSYWSAVMVRGSISPRSALSSTSIPPAGMEKGLWQNSSSPDSSPISYMGKSTIQQNS